LALLPKIEIQLVDCPLTGNMQVIAKHVKFLIELPKKLQFSFLGCFQMELRAIGFMPQFTGFPDVTSAMQVSGQIQFAEGGGDVLDTKIDLHNLFVALPAPGSFIPRLHLKGLSIRIKQGETFELYGAVDFFNGDDVEPGIPAYGFTGEGSVTIQGLPTIAAAFGFLRVSPDQRITWKRAWFLYLEARKLALQIPVIEIYIREIGIGFGYRYTLVSFKAIDNISDPKKLLKELKRLSKTQGNLSRRDQWAVDLENAGEDVRWTIALRALIAQTSASQDPFGADYDPNVEAELPCLFVLDVVIALRSDLTFLMAGRAWLDTNYHDFRFANPNGLQDKPLFSAFVMLSPRQKRFLANLSSNPDAEFGDHPPLPDFLKEAIRSCQFSATLLIEPGLVHYELGWPNQLQWKGDLGPLQAEFRGGAIFRVSTHELVIGNSFLARGTLRIEAGVDLGFVGASVFAIASVAYGARYIGVLSFDDAKNKSAFYGAIGVEIRVVVEVHFWLHLSLGFFSIDIDFSFSFQLNFTASLEVGILLTPDAGARGTATVAISVMGHDLHFNVHVGLNEGAVNTALGFTNKFLHIGLESQDVEPVPGTSGTTAMVANIEAALVHATAAPGPHQTYALRFAFAGTSGIQAPDYSIAASVLPSKNNLTDAYFLLLPAAPDRNDPKLRYGFFAVPPNEQLPLVNDFSWTFPHHSANVTFEHYNWHAKAFENDAAHPGTFSWQVDWAYPVKNSQQRDKDDNPAPQPPTASTLRAFLRHAYLKDPTAGTPTAIGDLIPWADPTPIFTNSDDDLSDERVNNPSDGAYEAAVQGAVDQFSSPFFKHDPDSPYDQALSDAFDPKTSIYSPSGTTDTLGAEQQGSHQLRGAVLQSLLRDFNRYVLLVKSGSTKDALNAFESDSLAFRLGLVFRASATGPTSEQGDMVLWRILATYRGARMRPREIPVDRNAMGVTQDAHIPEVGRVRVAEAVLALVKYLDRRRIHVDIGKARTDSLLDLAGAINGIRLEPSDIS